MNQLEMKDDAFRQNLSVTSTGSSWRTSVKEILSTYAALFASLTTLFCCALPALLVLLGFGLTSVLTFFTAIPGWENVGAYDIWLFPLSGGLLAVGFYFAYARQGPSQGEVCEIPAGGRESACSTATRWNRRILWLSLFLMILAVAMNFWGIDWMKTHGYFNH
jgi:ABC-type arginine transport system permease subunit